MKFVKKSEGNHEVQFPNFSFFVCQESMLSKYCIQNFENIIQFRIYRANREKVTHFGQLISVKVEKILRRSQAQFWDS